MLTIKRRDAGPLLSIGAGVHPVLARIYSARKITCAAEVDHRLRLLAPPHTLGGIDFASSLLADAITQDHRIMVVGDFDADGATGCAVGVRGLRLLGAKRVSFYVPNRAIHGYGLTPLLVEEIKRHSPDLLITVDQGISSLAGVLAAKAQGMKVIVTDHHLPGAQLPEADAIVNPNLVGDTFPSKALAGVGVLFYVLLAVRAQLRDRSWFGTSRAEPDLSVLLDLVAVGTVADMVPLDFNNRVLVAAGLKRIRSGNVVPGIRALFSVANRSMRDAVANDLGFSIGPRINAAGRLEDMSLGIECLITDDLSRAHQLAAQLDSINAERRELQADMLVDAEAIMARIGLNAAELPVGICVYDPSWHPGVIGLVASRLKEKWHRPAIALAPAGDGGIEWRGSARSVPGFHMRDALAAMATAEPQLLVRYGGHAMAAGFTVMEDQIENLVSAFDRQARQSLGRSCDELVLWSDGALSGAEANLDLALVLNQAGPWGQAFPEPSFDNVFEVESYRIVAERHYSLKLRYVECGTQVEAMHFNGVEEGEIPSRIHAVYQLSADEWRKQRRLRLIIRHRLSA
jgi:single-stranded-DNA-specific exonuclease